MKLITGDTDLMPVGGGTASGRSMRLGAVVMAKASDQIVEKGRRIAASLLEAAELDIEFARRRFTVKGTDRSVDLFEAAAAAVRAGEPLAGACTEVMPCRRIRTAARCAKWKWIPTRASSRSCDTRRWTTSDAQ